MEKDQITRREVLKTLAASGGALAAAAFLPEKWTKPVVEAGVLPAHAQASLCATISLVRGLVTCDNETTCPPGWLFSAIFSFTPADLALSFVDMDICGTVVPSAFKAVPGFSDQFYLFYNITPEEAMAICGGGAYTAHVVATFASGCNGVFTEVGGGNRRPAGESLLR